MHFICIQSAAVINLQVCYRMLSHINITLTDVLFTAVGIFNATRTRSHCDRDKH